MPNNVQAYNALNHRVWYVEGGVHPTRPPVLLALGKVSTDPQQSVGEATRITAPSPKSFNSDIQVGTVPGSEERATISVGIRSTQQASILMGWKNKGCRVDLFVLMGACGNPQDFTNGGDKSWYFPDGKISSHGGENLGAYGRDENNPSNEMVDMTSETYWEFLREKQQQIAATYTSRRIFTVDVYTGNDCEDCPEPCDRILATMAGTGATPGTKPSLLYSADSGATFSTQDITTLYSTEGVADAEVIGGAYVLVSNESNSIHWTDVELLYNGNNTWSEVVSGFVANKAPNAMSSQDVRHTWIVGNGGYVYFTKNFKVGVEVQDAGVATSQHLRAVHARDELHVLAVGDSNAVIFTENGGVSWQNVTGPSVGINLGACWMWDDAVWFVGEGAGGNGKLWLTVNSGKTWSQVGLPATYLRFYKILFVSDAEGYLLAADGSATYVLRTITAGYEWVVLPEGKAGTPVDNQFLTDVAVCSRFSNTAFAAGVAPNTTSGIILKMAGE